MILPVIRLNFRALGSTGYDASLYSITTLFPTGIPHNLCKPIMVSTSKQVLPSGLIPNTLIIIDINYFEFNINYKIYIRIYWHFYKYIYLSSRAGQGAALVEQGPLATSLVRHLSPHAGHSEPVSRCGPYPCCFGGIIAPHDHGNTSLDRSSSAVEVTYGICRTMKADTDTPVGSSLSDRML
jgi:hypothetical protein